MSLEIIWKKETAWEWNKGKIRTIETIGTETTTKIMINTGQHFSNESQQSQNEYAA